MSTTPHPRAQLSAYLDGALSPAERSAVEGHLASCDDCRARLGELRATASLIASLPTPVPSRRLVPRMAAVPVWLAPLRTLSTLASGIAVFLFIATALLANIGTLATSASTAASQIPALAPGAGAAAPAPAASGAFRNASGTSAPAGAPESAQDAAKAFASASASTNPGQFTAVTSSSESHGIVQTRSFFGDPWIWLVVAVVTGILAIYLQRRLRSA